MSTRQLQLMISSRNTTKVDLDGKTVQLSVVRKKLKEELEALDPFGTGAQFFKVWINEAMPAQPASKTPWEHSLDLVDRADIVLVVYNGDPGWPDKQTIGICHAELHRALSYQRLKVYGIELPLVPLPKGNSKAKVDERERYKRFRKYWKEQGFWTVKASNGRELIAAAGAALHEALCVLTRHGRRSKTGNYDAGDALTWSRYDFARRKRAMEDAILAALDEDYLASRIDPNTIPLNLDGAQLLVRVHAVPGAMTTAAAREMVGRPFHQDHEWTDELMPTKKGRGGPVHLIGCHRSVTEQQAVSLLGRPDVTTVVTNFGVLAVDQVTKVQCLLLKDCRDSGSTRQAVGLALDWLVRADEARLVEARAKARAKIVEVIHNELNSGRPP